MVNNQQQQLLLLLKEMIHMLTGTKIVEVRIVRAHMMTGL
jgi:hypothetical protein